MIFFGFGEFRGGDDLGDDVFSEATGCVELGFDGLGLGLLIFRVA
jgi:hypothetical protein